MWKIMVYELFEMEFLDNIRLYQIVVDEMMENVELNKIEIKKEKMRV